MAISFDPAGVFEMVSGAAAVDESAQLGARKAILLAPNLLPARLPLQLTGGYGS